MRNVSPSFFIALSACVALSTMSLQAAVENAAPSQGQTLPAPGVNPLNGEANRPNRPAEPSQAVPEKSGNSVPAQSEKNMAQPFASDDEGASPKKIQPEPKTKAVAAKFAPFTGKITKNKVRVRLQSAFDGPVLRELNQNDLVVVLGESEDFYAIQPPAETKAYVFRTFVLDNVIEGNRVNVRLKPDLEAPVVAQLNSGDRVEGVIYPASNKWMEINLPNTARFYIAKEYVEKAGDASLKGRLEKKKDEAYQLLNSTDAVAKAEMQKPFEQINLDGIKLKYQSIMQNYPEFPEAGLKAKEALALLQDDYTAKKLAYLENKSRSSQKLAAELEAQKSKISVLEQQIEKSRQLVQPAMEASQTQKKPAQLPINMTVWVPVEESLFKNWSSQTGNGNPHDYYKQLKEEGYVLQGIIDPYARPVKNKPGDFMLLNADSKLPIAFLYSTLINLQDYIGREVVLVVSPRNNNNFAFPAYFVLTVD